MPAVHAVLRKKRQRKYVSLSTIDQQRNYHDVDRDAVLPRSGGEHELRPNGKAVLWPTSPPAGEEAKKGLGLLAALLWVRRPGKSSLLPRFATLFLSVVLDLELLAEVDAKLGHDAQITQRGATGQDRTL